MFRRILRSVMNVKKKCMIRKNRRYLHPFINCTCCGPRLTILDALPYDRERTSMKEFPMCPDCAKEYYDEKTRRYDAQPVCCNECGPEVYLIGRSERGQGCHYLYTAGDPATVELWRSKESAVFICAVMRQTKKQSAVCAH